MRERLTTRLGELREQQRYGVERQRQLEQELAAMQATLLRISGAIQVIEEELQAEQAAAEQAAAEQAAAEQAAAEQAAAEQEIEETPSLT